MGMFAEFKEFAVKGNVVDLAVGVVIGAAFNKIVSSVVDDVIMPVVGALTGGRDFSQLFVSLDGNSYDSLAAAKEAGGAVIAYGSVVQNTLDFLIVAFVLFLVVKTMNRIRRAEEATAA